MCINNNMFNPRLISYEIKLEDWTAYSTKKSWGESSIVYPETNVCIQRFPDVTGMSLSHARCTHLPSQGLALAT